MILRKQEKPSMGIWKPTCVSPICALRKAFILKRGYYNEQHIRKLHEYLKKRGFKEIHYRANYEKIG